MPGCSDHTSPSYFPPAVQLYKRQHANTDRALAYNEVKRELLCVLTFLCDSMMLLSGVGVYSFVYADHEKLTEIMMILHDGCSLFFFLLTCLVFNLPL